MRVAAVHNGHDASVAIAVDDRIVVYIEEERLNGLRHGFNLDDFNARRDGSNSLFPWLSLSYCLDTVGLRIDDLDALVVTNANPFLRQQIPIRDRGKVCFAPAMSHHRLHAYAAFACSGFDEAAVLVCDGSGSVHDDGYETESGFVARCTERGPVLEPVFANRHPLDLFPWAGLGMMYACVSGVLGFHSRASGMDLSGKTMGLAAYGRADGGLPAFLDLREAFAIDYSPFQRFLEARGLLEHGTSGAQMRLAESKARFSAEECDLARHVQAELERGMLFLERQLRERTGMRRLCIGGGVGLNSVANGELRRRGDFDATFVPANCGDGGLALGALAWHRAERAASAVRPPRTFFLGRVYPDEVLTAAAAKLPGERIDDEAQQAQVLATAIAAGKVVALFHGGSEAGPRALGARSILADARDPAMRDRLNLRVKFRETFRPVAPVVPRECAAEWFEWDEAPYMLQVARVREDRQRRIPAAVHVDGTARLQTLRREDHPLLHRALLALGERTGVPVMINTSLNLKGAPIVETPGDAVRAFKSSEIDLLFLGPWVLRRPDDLAIEMRAAPGWEARLGAIFVDPLRDEYLTALASDARWTKAELRDVLEGLMVSLGEHAATAHDLGERTWRDATDETRRRCVLSLRRERLVADEESLLG